MSEADFTYRYSHNGAHISLNTFSDGPSLGFYTSRAASIRMSDSGALIVESNGVWLLLHASDEQLAAIAATITAALAKKDAA
jgi:hypothetical protein